MQKISHRNLARLVRSEFANPSEHRTAVCVVGGPGSGKTEGATMGKPEDEYHIEHMVRTMEEVFGNWRGVPTFDLKDEDSIPDTVLTLMDPKAKHILKKARACMLKKKSFILVLDEFMSTDHRVQKCASTLLDRMRELAGHKLPKNVIVVVTGNMKDQCAGALSALSHLVDRVVGPFELAPTVEDVISYGAQRGWDQRLLSFFAINPNAPFLPTDPTGDDRDKIEKAMYRNASANYEAFPTPRSWAGVNIDLQTWARKPDLYDDELFAIKVCGRVGDARGMQFMAQMDLKIGTRQQYLDGELPLPLHNPHEIWAIVIREAQAVGPDTSLKCADKILTKVSAEFTEMCLRLIHRRLENQGDSNAPFTTMRTWPGFDKILGEDSEYGLSRRV